jgi:type IV pilus assembly protein PilB
MVNSIPEEVINLFSREIVEKYKILPFRIERHKLHVAMLDPKDIKVIDDLRFKTGHEIIPT